MTREKIRGEVGCLPAIQLAAQQLISQDGQFRGAKLFDLRWKLSL
jgi:hypothetical protein